MQFLIYIGAALVIGLLIGFVALSVLWLRQTMVYNVRSHTLNLISVMDEILDEKSRELSVKEREVNQLEEEIRLLEEEEERIITHEGHFHGSPVVGVAPATFLAAVELARQDSYRDPAVGGTYRQIRKNFSFQVADLLPIVETQSGCADGPAGRLLNALEFDTVYHLSTLEAQEQLDVLRQCLPQEGLALLEGYANTHPQFSAIGFYDYLNSAAAAEPKTTRLYVPAQTPVGALPHTAVEIAEDEDICEGFQVELGGKLYDYCIKTKELG